MLNKYTVQLMALGLVGSLAATATADDSSALIDALVKKGVLKTKEAEQIRAQMSKDCSSKGSAGKLDLDSSVKSLALSGDVRLRYQSDSWKQQADNATPALNNENQNSRFELRLRVNADYKLADDFFAGFGLQTDDKHSGPVGTTLAATPSNNNPGGRHNNNLANDGQNYGIGISKAFLGWTPTPGVTLIAGKQNNPFYTTDMVWDPEIYPAGFTESINFNKAFGISGIDLTLVGGQFVVKDNTESNANNTNANRDAYIFHTQLIASVEIASGVKLTVAPGYYSTNEGYAAAGTFPAPATDTTLRNLQVLLLPGDVSTEVAGLKTKFLWDLAYNLDGTQRTKVGSTGNHAASPSPIPAETDYRAWLLGVKVGENKKKGDWSVSANYREVGYSAVDGSVNGSDFAYGYTNMKGFTLGVAYNLGDAATLGASYIVADNIRKESIGSLNSAQILQVDLGVKF